MSGELEDALSWDGFAEPERRSPRRSGSPESRAMEALRAVNAKGDELAVARAAAEAAARKAAEEAEAATVAGRWKALSAHRRTLAAVLGCSLEQVEDKNWPAYGTFEYEVSGHLEDKRVEDGKPWVDGGFEACRFARRLELQGRYLRADVLTAARARWPQSIAERGL